jgi:hypothetical protein
MLEGHEVCSRTHNNVTGRSLPCILNPQQQVYSPNLLAVVC